MENEYAFRHLMVLLQRLRTFPVVLEEVIFDVYYAIVFNAFSLSKVPHSNHAFKGKDQRLAMVHVYQIT